MYVCYNNNTHDMLEVDASDSPMQGIHSESLWTGMLVGQHHLLMHNLTYVF